MIGVGYQCSLMLDSEYPVMAERPMYFTYRPGDLDWDGGHCVAGAASLSDEYFFSEGTTRSGFEEWLCLQNPGTKVMNVKAVYQLGPGQGGPVERSYVVLAGTRLTILVNDEVGPDVDVSIHLTADCCFLAERPMYFNYHDAWTGGSCVLGSTVTSGEWCFAEGYTGEGFEEWLCLQNPGTADATVEITYFTQEQGALPARTWVVPAASRLTIPVNQDAGAGYQLSARLEVTSGPGIMVERPMYFNYNGVWNGGHDTAGFNLE